MNLNQITVPVLDIERSIQFYKTLGFKLIVYSEDHYARFELPSGDSTFSIHKVPALPMGEGIWLYLEVTDVEKEVNRLIAKGVVFQTEVIDQNWLWTEASLKDPDNNKIIIYHAGEYRKNPPWRIQND